MQINKGFTDKDFASMLNEYNYDLHPGDIVAGTIFHQESHGFLIDIGAEIAGYLPIEEISLQSNSNNKSIDDLNNQTREFFIVAYKKTSQQLLLSIKRLDYIRAWKRIKQLESEDIILRLMISGNNKGGLITIIEGLQGFIPNSHLAVAIESIVTMHDFINCKLLLANEKTNQLILSNKKAILSLATNKLIVGDLVEGKVIKVEPYGVFVEIKNTNMPALLHISELGDKNIPNIKKIFQIGDNIKIKIIHIDTEQGRISVSRRNIN